MNSLNIKKISNSRSNILYPYGYMSEGLFDDRRPEIKRGSGTRLFTSDGKEMIDLISGLWNNPLGYNNPGMTRALVNQAKELAACTAFDYSYELLKKNAGRLLALHKGAFSKIGYTCSGSEAVELAIKVIRKYHANKGHFEKNTILTLNGSYHGTSYGALSLSMGEKELFEDYGPGLPEIIGLEPIYPSSENKENRIKDILDWIDQNSDRIGGMVLEPILFSRNNRLLDVKYVQSLREICREKDIVMVFDEVATGFYRTGKMFCYMHYDVIPDVICNSKAVNSGMVPMGTTLFSEAIERVALKVADEQFLHGSTCGASPLAIAASNEALNQYSSLFASDEVEQKTERFRAELAESLKNSTMVSGIERTGNTLFIYLDKEIVQNGINPVVDIRNSLRTLGVVTYPAAEGLLMLPMYITEDTDYSEAREMIRRAFTE